MKKYAIGLFVAALLFSGSHLSAVDMHPLPIEKLRDSAHAIVHGTVLNKSVQRDPEGRIFTKVVLQVTESWKGKVDGAHFVLVHAGGVLGDESSVAPGQEDYAIGEEVVAFVVLNHRGEGVTVGLSQGKFHVARDPGTGEMNVSNRFHGRAAAAGSTSPQAEARKSPLSLLELKQRVQKGRP